MSFIRFVKSNLLQIVDSAGLNAPILNSPWRKRRLAVICWHGVSNDDEHRWDPGLFMRPEALRMRLGQLRALKCNVLPLAEGLARARSGSLPPRAVCLTVDDGDSSFHLLAWPMLREFGFPATLYWTTYYSTHPYAVFDPMLSYLLWKGRQSTLALSDPGLRCDLRDPGERRRAFTALYEFARDNAWTGQRKEAFLAELARLIGVDYARIKSRRVLHMISPAEARSMVAEGLDLQLHTHRHRVPRNPDLFAAELAENSRILREVGAKAPAHFCYPSGSYLAEFADWLRESRVESATTCQFGLVERDSNPYFLPRLMDNGTSSTAEFRGGLSGIAALLSRRHGVPRHGFA
ncbi:MAG: polysaccharide deacetylase family protein [Proteobacteria bacterium]|nr:polysaccharide deacetylase family protein [Pseudomonadota bacterium]